jgi:hypothetical protein
MCAHRTLLLQFYNGITSQQLRKGYNPIKFRLWDRLTVFPWAKFWPLSHGSPVRLWCVAFVCLSSDFLNREAVAEFGENFASRLKLTKDGTTILWPQPTDDPRDPQNVRYHSLFSAPRRSHSWKVERSPKDHTVNNCHIGSDSARRRLGIRSTLLWPSSWTCLTFLMSRNQCFIRTCQAIQHHYRSHQWCNDEVSIISIHWTFCEYSFWGNVYQLEYISSRCGYRHHRPVLKIYSLYNSSRRNIGGDAHAEAWSIACSVLVTSQPTTSWKITKFLSVHCNQLLALAFLIGATFSPTLRDFASMQFRYLNFVCVTHVPFIKCFAAWPLSSARALKLR